MDPTPSARRQGSGPTLAPHWPRDESFHPFGANHCSGMVAGSIPFVPPRENFTWQFPPPVVVVKLTLSPPKKYIGLYPKVVKDHQHHQLHFHFHMAVFEGIFWLLRWISGSKGGSQAPKVDQPLAPKVMSLERKLVDTTPIRGWK